MEPDSVKDAAKKILFIAPQPYFQWRGSPIRVGFDVQALAENGNMVDLLVLPFGEDRNIEGVRVFRASNLPGVRNVGIGPSFAKACFDVLLLFKAWSLHRKNRYDAVHCVEDAGVIGRLLSAFCGTKFIFEKHSDPSSYRKGVLKNALMTFYAAVEKGCVRSADAVICTGPGLAQQARSYGGKVQVHCISDIPSSLKQPEAAETAAVRKSWGLVPEAVVAAYVGSFAVYQGVGLLFEAFALAVKRLPELRLFIVGGSDDEIEERRKFLKAKGCLDSVIFAGKIPPDRLPAYLAAADILVSPRISGVNTPLKLLDYLKAGRAILAADTEANRLILDDNTAAFAAPEAGDMSNKLVQLGADMSLRDKLAANGRNLADREYNYSNFREGLRKAYESVGWR